MYNYGKISLRTNLSYHLSFQKYISFPVPNFLSKSILKLIFQSTNITFNLAILSQVPKTLTLDKGLSLIHIILCYTLMPIDQKLLLSVLSRHHHLARLVKFKVYQGIQFYDPFCLVITIIFQTAQ